MSFAPVVLSVHLCATFFVLANLAVRDERVFRAVRLGLGLVALGALAQAPLAGAYLLLPLLAAGAVVRVRVPDRVDPSWA